MRTETSRNNVYWFISWKNSLNEDMDAREHTFAYTSNEAKEIEARIREDSHNYDIKNEIIVDREREFVEQ